MPKPRNPGSYPQSVRRLYLVLEEVPEITIPFATEKEAKAWRFDFYGYREALRQKNKDWQTDFPRLNGIVLKLLPPDDGNPEWRILAKQGDEDRIWAHMQAELSRQRAVQEGAGAVPVSTERQDDGELER